MAKPTSRQELINYCLRNLGAPVLEINVDEEQLEDRFEEALQFYQEYHSDAIVRHYRKHQVTQTDIDNRYVDLPDNLLFVSRVLPLEQDNRSGMFSLDYQLHLNDIYDLRSPGTIINYVMTEQYMSLLDQTFNGLNQRVRFNRHMNRIYIDTDWEIDYRIGDYLVIEGYSTVDPQTYPDVYNDIFLKRYLTALIKRQWGVNMKKYEGIQLPGGVTLNGQQIYDEANDEIRNIEEEMQLKYEMPPMGEIG
jgi:hypothetical protein